MIEKNDSEDGQEIWLELGCGSAPIKPKADVNVSIVRIDLVELPDVDIVCDLNHGIPTPSNVFDQIAAIDIIEHLDDVMKIMNEMHRVLVPNGLASIRVPVYGSWTHRTDPTHKHGFTTESFDYFDNRTELGRMFGFYTNRRWWIEHKSSDDKDLSIVMRAEKPFDIPESYDPNDKARAFWGARRV